MENVKIDLITSEIKPCEIINFIENNSNDYVNYIKDEINAMFSKLSNGVKVSKLMVSYIPRNKKTKDVLGGAN